jgi:hypothetical protein
LLQQLRVSTEEGSDRSVERAEGQVRLPVVFQLLVSFSLSWNTKYYSKAKPKCHLH